MDIHEIKIPGILSNDIYSNYEMLFVIFTFIKMLNVVSFPLRLRKLLENKLKYLLLKYLPIRGYM